MNAISLFSFENTAIRTTVKDETPWFCAADICTALGVKNHRDSLMHLDDDEKGVVSTDTLGGKQDISVVNESGLYALVLRSRKPAARKFVKWVTGEVLPTIRKTGSYTITINPEQQRAIQEAVNAYVIKHQTTHQSVYHSIKTKFKVAKYDQLPVAQFLECMDYLEGRARAIAPPALRLGVGQLIIERSRLIDLMRDMKTMQSNMGKLYERMDYMSMMPSDLTEENWQRQAITM